MKIVVTGGAGAIGSHMAEALLLAGHEVVVIDALTDYYNPKIKEITIKDLVSKGIVFIRANLVGMTAREIPEDTDIIFHFAAQPGISATTPFEDYVTNNIYATHSILEVARSLKHLKGFIHISTSSVYGREAHGDETTLPKPISNYGATKLSAEELALLYERAYGLPVMILRFFSVYGERERPEKLYHKLIRSIENGEEFPLFEGSENHVRSYTYVKDIVDGCLLALNNVGKYSGEIFNIGTDVTHTTLEGITLVESIMGKKARLKKLPPRLGDQKETSANIKKARTMFGYNPQTTLKDGLTAEVKWYREKIHGKV